MAVLWRHTSAVIFKLLHHLILSLAPLPPSYLLAPRCMGNDAKVLQLLQRQQHDGRIRRRWRHGLRYVAELGVSHDHPVCGDSATFPSFFFPHGTGGAKEEEEEEDVVAVVLLCWDMVHIKAKYRLIVDFQMVGCACFERVEKKKKTGEKGDRENVWCSFGTRRSGRPNDARPSTNHRFYLYCPGHLLFCFFVFILD